MLATHALRGWPVLIVALAMSLPVSAHRSYCHAEHSCPTEHGTYVCGDFGDCSECPDNAYCKDRSPRADRPPLAERKVRKSAASESPVNPPLRRCCPLSLGASLMTNR